MKPADQVQYGLPLPIAAAYFASESGRTWQTAAKALRSRVARPDSEVGGTLVNIAADSLARATMWGKVPE